MTTHPVKPMMVWTWATRRGANRYYLTYNFAAPTKGCLVAGGKPSPDAVPVQVVMHPVKPTIEADRG